MYGASSVSVAAFAFKNPAGTISPSSDRFILKKQFVTRTFNYLSSPSAPSKVKKATPIRNQFQHASAFSVGLIAVDAAMITLHQLGTGSHLQEHRIANHKKIQGTCHYAMTGLGNASCGGGGIA